MAEGAISKEDAKLSKKEYKKKLENYTFPSVSYELADRSPQKESPAADKRTSQEYMASATLQHSLP